VNAAAHPEHTEVAGAYARLLVDRARYREAHDIPAAGDAVRVRAESAGLAALPTGDLKTADAALAALEAGAVADGDAATAGRALALRATVAEQRGQLGIASDRYREAARQLTTAGELHAAAVAVLRLGTVLVERGRAGEAIPRLTEAGQRFGALSASADHCTAELHLGTALLLGGQLEAARAVAATAVARSAGAPLVRAFALRVAGEARRRLGDMTGAMRNFREALAIAATERDAGAQLAARLALADAGTCDDPALEPLCSGDQDRDRCTLARGRQAIRGRSPVGDALARACADVASRAADEDRLERAFRGHAIAAHLAHRAGELDLLRGEIRNARLAHAALAAAVGPAFRTALEGDPDLLRLPELRMPQAWLARKEPEPSEDRKREAQAVHPQEEIEREVELARAHVGAEHEMTLARREAEWASERAALARQKLEADRALDELRAHVGAERDAALARQKLEADRALDELRAHVGAERDAPTLSPSALQLRPALSALEHAYITAAMTQTRGNQTAAARLLGLSRFGLQKKLRRLS
jgi:hypothetical protein